MASTYVHIGDVKEVPDDAPPGTFCTITYAIGALILQVYSRLLSTPSTTTFGLIILTPLLSAVIGFSFSRKICLDHQVRPSMMLP